MNLQFTNINSIQNSLTKIRFSLLDSPLRIVPFSLCSVPLSCPECSLSGVLLSSVLFSSIKCFILLSGGFSSPLRCVPFCAPVSSLECSILLSGVVNTKLDTLITILSFCKCQVRQDLLTFIQKGSKAYTSRTFTIFLYKLVNMS